MIQVGCSTIEPEGIEMVNDVLKSGMLSYGKYSKLFEQEFAEAHESKYGVIVSSGTDALRIALATLKEVHRWKDGDEVICPALTFIASSNVILQNNLKPVFVDVRPDTYNIDAKRIPNAITKRTRAILPVHLFGLPAEMSAISAIGKKYRLKIVEDSCETMFVKHQGKPVGAWGDMACFSYYMAHLVTTGVGGMIVTKNAHYASVARSYANHGRDIAYMGGSLGFQKIGDPNVIKKRFLYHRIGYSSRVTEMEAALGLAQLRKSVSVIIPRLFTADLIKDGLRAKGLDKYLQLPVDVPGAEQSNMMLPLVLKKGNAVKLMAHLEKVGIETRRLMPLLNQPVYRKIFGDIEKKYPVAKWLARNGFYIGCHQQMTHKDVDHVVDTLAGYFTEKTMSEWERSRGLCDVDR